VLARPNDLWLVYFYAPWCGHCKRLAPIFEEVAAAPEVKHIRFGKVDATIEKALSSHYNVTGFPTIAVMHEGRTWEHKGARSRDGLLALLTRMQEPPVKELRTEEDLQSLQSSATGGVAFVLGVSSSPHPIKNMFLEVARTRQHIDRFGISADDKVLSTISPSSPPYVAKVAHREDAIILPSMDVSADKMVEWVMDNRFPQCSMLDRHNFFDVSAAGKPLVTLFLDPASFCQGEKVDCESRELLEDDTNAGVGAAMRALARELEPQKQMRFGIIDGRKWRDFAEDHLISVETMPRLLVIDHKAKTFQVDSPGDAATSETMRAFLGRVRNGEVRVEYEDYRGMPDRWWRKAVSWIPAIGILDFLPRYTFSFIALCTVCYLVYVLMMFEPMNDGYDLELDERPGAPVPRKSSKAD